MRGQHAAPRRAYWKQWTTFALILLAVIGIGSGLAIGAATNVPITVTLSDASGNVLGQTTISIPIPTVTVTATPTTTPTVTPTVTPTTTPPSSTSPAITLWGVSNRVYDGVTFDGSGSGGADSSGVIFIGSRCTNLTFRNCTINTNKDGVGNGVKVYSGAGEVSNITFENCHFMYQPRMGIEVIGRGGTYKNVNVINCTFEVQGSEVISYDGSGCGYSRVEGNLCKGGGAGTFPWQQGIELNGVYNMTVTNNILYSCRGSGFNFNGPGGNCGWVVTSNTIDFSQGDVQSTTEGNPVVAHSITGGVFTNNHIINKNAWTIAYFSGCNGMDWRGTTWSGPNATPHQINCSGNLF